METVSYTHLDVYKRQVIDSSKIKISKSHRNAILALMQSKRSQIQSASIFDVMDSDFFLSPFWKLISALYGFTEESSAYELSLIHI